MSRAGRFLLLAAGLLAFGLRSPADGQKTKPWDGSRTTPVHLIPLKDENDQVIVPTETDPMPFSARFTCGPCHDYKTIKAGWHFSAMKSEKNGRPGEPWIWLDPKTGTVLPLSYRKWPGTRDPRDVGLNAWDFTQLFGRHMPGGGPGEPGENDIFLGADSRWNVSGKAEINCLACHNASSRQDHSEWAKQILRQNLRWAATAAAGIGEVDGMASRLKETWDVYDGPSLDDHEWAVAPSVKYRTVDFDGKHRFFFDIAYPPGTARCLACHSVTPVGETKANAEADVHTAAGLKCADCHRNDLGHGMIRGYEGEASVTGNRMADSFTCRGCHMGEDATGERRVVPGRLGAPYPKHVGIPLVHFRRLACTVCHSGPMPKKDFTMVRTSRANRLGIHGVAQWSTELPAVIEPVYARDSQHKIGPNRLVWPAFWARVEGQKLIPLQPGVVEAAAGDILGPDERIAAVLAALAQAAAEDEVPVLVSGKFIFEANVDLGLDATEVAAASRGGTVRWAMKKGVTVNPLVPDFDPASADKDPAAEQKVQAVLEALGTVAGTPGRPAVVVKKTLYQIKDGNLDSTEVSRELTGAAGPGWLKDGKLEPLASDFDIRTITAKAGGDRTLTEEQVGLTLRALAAAKPKAGGASSYFYLSGGMRFGLDKEGKLVGREASEASAVTWPLAHNVRPKSQSLGRNGCTDCHSASAPFFFAKLKGSGPLLTDQTASRSAASLMGVGGFFHRVFGLTFVVRPAFKILLFLAALVSGALLLAFFVTVVGKLSGLTEKR